MGYPPGNTEYYVKWSCYINHSSTSDHLFTQTNDSVLTFWQPYSNEADSIYFYPVKTMNDSLIDLQKNSLYKFDLVGHIKKKILHCENLGKSLTTVQFRFYIPQKGEYLMKFNVFFPCSDLSFVKK